MRTDNVGLASLGSVIMGKKSKESPPSTPAATTANEKSGTPEPSNQTVNSDTSDSWGVTESEWEQAQRAGRTATWGSIFYLITTDILGPTNVPWAISKMGYGPGFALYTAFGAMACYSGMQLWHMFVGLDSTRFPMRNYGDVAFRIFGSWARIVVNFLQSFQFFLNVALLITSNGQGLAQMAAGVGGNGFLCFIVAEVIFMLIGFALGQIRTLQRLSWLANIAIWLNVIVIIMTMAVVYQYPPNYDAVAQSYNIPEGPVQTTANWPESSTLNDKVNAMMNGVFAYGGATLFNELMAEMRRPYDFWKGFICAEIFIYACYLIMGMVVYSAQGQFTFNPAYQGEFFQPLLPLSAC
jgi:amino acid permease